MDFVYFRILQWIWVGEGEESRKILDLSRDFDNNSLQLLSISKSFFKG